MADAPQSTSAGGFETTPLSMPLAEAVELVLKQHAMREHRDDPANMHATRVSRDEWREMARWLRDTLQRVYVDALLPTNVFPAPPVTGGEPVPAESPEALALAIAGRAYATTPSVRHLVQAWHAALKSIAANSCCEPCREAALVAQKALR